MEKVEDDSGLITLHLISGSMIKSNQKKQGKLEFRQIKGTRLVIVHLYDYIRNYYGQFTTSFKHHYKV